MTAGEKITILAEIIRLTTRGARASEVTEELSLSARQAATYIRFLKSKKLIVLVDDSDYFPSEKGLAYLATYDKAADLVDLEEPDVFYSGKSPGTNRSLYWHKADIASRMHEIIDR